MGPADFDPGEYETASIQRRHPNAGAASIEAMTQHVCEDRLSSQKRSAELSHDNGSESTVETRDTGFT